MMNSALPRYAGLLCLLTMLVGCGSSPPSKHYVLTARPASAPSGDTPSLGIGPIRVPEYLNRNSLVYQRQGNELQVSGTERWAEPLEDGLKRVISMNLALLVNTQNVRLFPWNAQRAPDYGIKVNLLSLDANDQEVRMVAEWLVYRPDTSETVRRRISKFRQPLPEGELQPEQIAPAYSALVYQLSEIIAQTITSAEAQRAGRPED